MASFQDRLRELREERNLTQQELGQIIGVSKSTIAMYEQGKRKPKFEIQEALADYFNVDLDYLTGRSDKTTVAMPVKDAKPQRRFLLDKIAKADDKKLDKIAKRMEIIDEEEQRDW